MVLISDAGGVSGPSVIHKLNPITGKYLGTIGAFFLKNAGAVAIDREGTTVFVADNDGIKAFDIVTGAYQGLAVGLGKSLPSSRVLAMGFNSNRSLFVVEKDASPYGFTIRRFLSYRYELGAVEKIHHYSEYFAGAVSVCAGPSFSVHLFRTGLGATYNSVYTVNGNLNGGNEPMVYFATHEVPAMDLGDFRNWSGSLVRVLGSGEIRVNYGYARLDGVGAHFGWLGQGKYVGAAECWRGKYLVGGDVTLATQIGTYRVTLTNLIDLSENITTVNGAKVTSYFPHGNLKGIAAYRKPGS